MHYAAPTRPREHSDGVDETSSRSARSPGAGTTSGTRSATYRGRIAAVLRGYSAEMGRGGAALIVRGDDERVRSEATRRRGVAPRRGPRRRRRDRSREPSRPPEGVDDAVTDEVRSRDRAGHGVAATAGGSRRRCFRSEKGGVRKHRVVCGVTLAGHIARLHERRAAPGESEVERSARALTS